MRLPKVYAKGTPQVTERTWIVPPSSQIGPIADADRDRLRQAGPALYGHYEQAVDRESAYEKLTARTLSRGGGTASPVPGPPPSPAGSAGRRPDRLTGVLFGTTGPRGGHHEGLFESAAKSAARSVGSNIGRAIIRGALGSILGGRSR